MDSRSRRFRRPLTARRCAFPVLFSLLCAVLISGCTFDIRKWFQPPEPCVFGPNPTKEQVVRHVNARARRLTAWRSNDVSITTRGPNGIPVHLSAVIAVQRPRNFRLVASAMMGYEADFGSNADRIWFWMRRADPKGLYTVQHANLDRIEGRMPIPFRPDWLMEALGVIPLDEQAVEMLPREPGSSLLQLVSREATASGKVAHRVIVVDACHGHIVSQSLQNESGQVVASASFSDYARHTPSGLKMPHRIELTWPQTKTTMTLRIGGNIEVNPPGFPAKTWQVPDYEGYPVVDLARGIRNLGPPGNPSRRVAPGRVTIPSGRVPLTPAGHAEVQPPARPQFYDELPQQ